MAHLVFWFLFARPASPAHVVKIPDGVGIIRLEQTSTSCESMICDSDKGCRCVDGK